jgi:hypothetical protein
MTDSYLTPVERGDRITTREWSEHGTLAALGELGAAAEAVLAAWRDALTDDARAELDEALATPRAEARVVVVIEGGRAIRIEAVAMHRLDGGEVETRTLFAVPLFAPGGKAN